MLSAAALTQEEATPSAQEEASGATPTVTTPTPGETGPNDSILNKPPVLTVAYDDKSVEAFKGTNSWTYSNGDGTYTSVLADSMHPLQAKKYMTPLDLTPAGSSSESIKVYLQWDAIPDQVSIRCWSEDYCGQTGAESENIPVKTSETDFIIELKDDNRIYAVAAQWDRPGTWGGTALYSFYTLKPDMESHFN